MSDTAIVDAPVIEEKQPLVIDPNAAFNGVEKISDAIVDTPIPPATKQDEDIFDEAQYVKNTFGWDTPDAGKAELEELRKLKALPKQEPLTFADEDSRKIYDYIKEGKGKRSELLKVLTAQEKLSEVTGYDLSKSEQAAEIIKLGMLYKNKDLSTDDVDFLFNKKFSLPDKPVKADDQDDAEFEQAVSIWQKQVSLVEREMIIEAKLAKPDLAKFQSELVLPDIHAVDPIDIEAQQKDLETQKAARTTYLKSLESDYKKFNGYTAIFKDEDVELPISYLVPEQERTALKEQLQNFDKDAFIDELWFNEDGSPKIDQIMGDIYFLKNRDKIFQKLVNESAMQRLLAYRKKTSNIDIDNSSKGIFQPSEKSTQQLQEDAIWSA